MMAVVVFAISILFIIYGIFYYIGTDVLEYYFLTSPYISSAQAPYVESLQEYVNKNEISLSECNKLKPWLQENKISYFTVSVERELIYGITYVGEYMMSGDASADLHETWQYFRKIEFADAEADVYIYANYIEKIYFCFYILSGVLSVAISLTIVFRFIKKMFDDMQLRLEKTMESEKEVRQSKDELIRSMAHDLRTPLTGLVAYTEIVRMENKEGQVKPEHIEVILDKANDIKELTDQLFDFSIVSMEKEISLDEAADVEVAIGDYLSDFCSILYGHGFEIDDSKIKWKSVKVAVNSNLLGRIYNNLSNNICKYGAKEKPVIMEIDYKAEWVHIILINQKKENITSFAATGIGLKNVQMMMEKMHGKLKIEEKHKLFQVVLSFPIRG